MQKLVKKNRFGFMGIVNCLAMALVACTLDSRKRDEVKLSTA